MRPNLEDVQKFYQPYLALAKGDDIVEILANAKNETLELFSEIDEEKGNYAYADGKWTIKQVLQHIIDSEVVFAYRCLWIVRKSEGDLQGYDQDQWVAAVDTQTKTLQSIVAQYEATRNWTIEMFKNNTENELLKVGTANGYPIKALILPYLIAGHNLHHLNVLKSKYL